MLNPLQKRLLKPAKQTLQHLIVGEPAKDLRLLPDQLFFTYDEIVRTIEQSPESRSPSRFLLRLKLCLNFLKKEG
jgi:hypothetical protein